MIYNIDISISVGKWLDFIQEFVTGIALSQWYVIQENGKYSLDFFCLPMTRLNWLKYQYSCAENTLHPSSEAVKHRRKGLISLELHPNSFCLQFNRSVIKKAGIFFVSMAYYQCLLIFLAGFSLFVLRGSAQGKLVLFIYKAVCPFIYNYYVILISL